MRCSTWKMVAAGCLAASLGASSAFAQGKLGGALNGSGPGNAVPNAVPNAVRGGERGVAAPPAGNVPRAPAAASNQVRGGAGVNVRPPQGAPQHPVNDKPQVIKPQIGGAGPQVGGASPRVNPPQVAPRANPPQVGGAAPRLNPPQQPNIRPNQPSIHSTRKPDLGTGQVPGVGKVTPPAAIPRQGPEGAAGNALNRNPNQTTGGVDTRIPNARQSLNPDQRLGGSNQTNRLNGNNAGQRLGGNQINLGNTSINLAAQSYRPAYQWHPRRYAGYWGGNYGWGGPGWGYGGGGGGYGYGGYGYGYRPLGWGLGAWGLGTLAYNSGYLGYYNPYYSSGYGGYNYAQPVPVIYSDAGTAPINGASAENLLDTAVAAFQQGDFDRALDLVNKGISQYPSDAVLHEFRGLILFAKADYQQAASTIHSVLAVGPGWNWETLRGFYADGATYTNQLRALEAFTQSNPEDASSRFLLAYHYMAGGHQDAAARKLKEVVRLAPDDRVAADLLRLTTAPAPAQTPGAATTAPAAPIPQPPESSAIRSNSAAPSIDPAMLVGTWRAAREDGSQFDLTLGADRTFTWSFVRKEVKQEFSGQYSVEGNVIALERKDGGSLVGVVTPDGPQKFNFKLVGAPQEDTGLNFQH